MTFKGIIKKIRLLFQSTYSKIVIIMMIPSLLLIIYGISTSLYYTNSYKNLLISSYTNELNNFLSHTEEQMNSIISTSAFISQTSDINNLLTTSDISTSPANISYILDNAKNSSPLIESIVIYNKSENYVITTSGTYSPDEYFSSLCAYERYPLDYWFNFNSTAKSTIILPASKVVNNIDSISQTLVPVVFTPFNIADTRNIIIFNVSIDSIFHLLEECNLTNNSEFYMIDNSNGNLFSNQSNINFSEDKLKNIRPLNESLRFNSEIVSNNSKKFLSIKSTKRSNIWGYTYQVLIPMSDINLNIATILTTTFVFFVCLALALALFIYMGTKKLYSPWKNLVLTVDGHKDISVHTTELPKNVEDYLSSEFSSVIDMNQKLRQNLSVSLPLSQEKYLIDILNNNTYEHTDSALLEPLKFKFDYFISVAVNIDIHTPKLVSNYIIDTTQVTKEIIRTIKHFFSEEFITYKLPSENNILYLILNLDSSTSYEEIQSVADRVLKHYEAEKEKLSLFIALGNIYPGIEGLRLTHQEALSKLVNEINSDKVRIFQNNNNLSPFNLNKENILKNYLVAGYTDKASDLLNNVFEQISSLPTKEKNQVYFDILYTIEKSIRQKGIQLKNRPTEIIKTLSKDDEICAYIQSLIDIVAKDMKRSSTKLDISAVINYIDEHYTEELYLDELAKIHNTSMKYLSKRISQHLNMPFKDYITKLRIDKAVSLLETTNMSMVEIYESLGFQNRATFLRAFKTRIGMSPSEYKKNCANN